MAYRFSDPSSAPFVTFYAQKDILANITNDIGFAQCRWSLCSRAGVFDDLFNLSIVSTDHSNSCFKLRCGRSWKEIVNALDDQTYVYNLTSGINHVIFYWLPADPSTNRIPEYLFSDLSNNITSITTSAGGSPNAINSNGTWTYTPELWEVQTDTLYILDMAAADTLTLTGPIEKGDKINLRMVFKVFNENICICPNILNIDYVATLDKSLSSYCSC